MANQIAITGYEPECECEHCGRKLQHGVKTDALGIIGADCFNKLITADRRKFSGNGKPGASLVRDMAKIRERYSDEGMRRLGRYPHHFIFELAA